jgi:NAD(P)-dependent dehydrogenase (short-subunit alcohol dehydrogenase family)
VRGRNLAYKVSKAALNQLTVNMARDFVRDEANVTANAIHPGWIPTKVSGFTGPDDMQEVVDSIVETIIRLGSSDNGRFMDRHGSDMAF